MGSGGQVLIRDASTSPTGLIDISGGLTIDANGDAGTSTGRVTITSDSGAISVGGGLAIGTRGDINFTMFNDGQLTVGGTATLGASGNIGIRHANQPMGLPSVDVEGSFIATAPTGAFIASDNGDIDANGPVSITAESISYDNITSPGIVTLNATNGSITGASDGTITASSGVVDAINLDATQDITFGTLFATNGSIDIDAGGDITGVRTDSEESQAISAPGTITIDAIDMARAANGGATISGGVVDIGSLNATFLVDVTSTTGDLAIDDLDGTTSVDLISAGAITLGTADIGGINADATGDFTVDSLTTSQTTAVDFISSGGTATYTNIDSARGIDISAVRIDGRDVVAVGQIDLEAESIDIGTATSTQGFLNITSTVGDVSTGDLASTNFGVNVDSAGPAGLGNITANGNIDIDAVNDLTMGNATAGGALLFNIGGNLGANTLVSNSGSAGAVFTIGGDANILSLSSTGTFVLNIDGALTGGDFRAVGAFSILDIDAGSIDVDLVESVNQNVAVSALTGDAIIGTALSSSNTTITGANVTLNSGTIGRDLTLNATNGSINGTGVITVDGSIDLDATQDIGFGSLTSSSFFSVDAGGDVSFTAASAQGNLIIDAGGSVTGGSADSVLDTFAQDNVQITAGGDITLDSASAINEINLDGANVDVGTLDGQRIVIAATNLASVGNAISGSIADIDAGTVTIDSADIGTNLFVTSTVGDITGSGTITVGSTATLDSAANIAIGDLEATEISLMAGENVSFDGLTSPNTIRVIATNGTIGATTPGLGDIDSGGAVELTAQTIDVGDVISTASITAEATAGDAVFGDLNAGTFIDITAAGSPIAQSVTSAGDTTLTGASVTLNGGDVGGNLSVNATAGDINVGPDGTQQLLVGGSATFNATGDMLVTHTNNTTGAISVDVGQGISIDVGGSFTSQSGAILDSVIQTVISADGDIEADDLRSVEAILLQAAGNVTLNNASATGPQNVSNLSGIVIDAGVTFDPTLGAVFDPNANATITGTVTSYRDIDITAGGNAVFASGSNTIADNSLIVNTGDDIIVEAGAMLSSASNPTDPIDPADPFGDGPNLILNAGGETNIFSTPLTPISSVVIDGTLNANSAAIILEGNAIEALDSSLFAGSISADVRDAPPSPVDMSDPPLVQSDDDGLLSGLCLEGNVCLGNMQATNRIEIGQNSNNNVIQLFIEQAEVSATDILITTRENIVMGTSGINTVLNATGTFSATSLTGDVNLREAEISADLIFIEALGSLIGSGSLVSGTDIGITVGQDIDLAGLNAAGRFDTVENIQNAISDTYFAPGNFSVGRLEIGVGDLDVDAAGDILMGRIVVNGGAIILDALGDTRVERAQDASSITLVGNNVVYADLVAADFVDIEAIAGDVSFDFDIEFGDIDAGSDISVVAAGRVETGSLTSGGIITLDGGGDVTFAGLDAVSDVTVDSGGFVLGFGDIVSGANVLVQGADISISDVMADGTASIDGASIRLGDAVANQIDLTSASDIFFNLLQSPNAISLMAANGTIGANLSPFFNSNSEMGNIVSDGDVTIDAQTIDIDDVAALGSVTANATAGDANFGVVNATTDITITATGTPTVVNAISGGNTSITGASVTFDNGMVGGNLTLNATSGNVTGDGTVTVGGAIDIDASLDVIFGSLDAAGGSFMVNAGRNISFVSLSSTDAITINAVSMLDLGTISAMGAISLRAGEVDYGNLTATGDVTVTSTADDVFGGSLISGGNVLLTSADQFDINPIEATGSVTIDATGRIEMGDVDAGGLINIIASGSIAAGDLTSSNGAITVESTGSLVRTRDVAAATDITLIGQAIDAGMLDAGGLVETTASDGALTTAAINAGGAVTLSAANGAITAGDIDTTGDVTANAGAGDATLGVVDAGGSVDVQALGTASLAGLSSGMDASVIAGGVAIGGGTVGGDLTLEATDDDLDATGMFDVGGAIALTASGDVEIGSLEAQGGDFDVSAGGAIDFNSAAASGALDFAAGTAINGGAITSADTIDLVSSSGPITTGVLASNGAVAVDSAGDFTTDDVTQMGGDLVIDAAGNVTFASATGSDSASITAGAMGGINGANLQTEGAATLNAGTGGISLGGLEAVEADLIADGGAISIDNATVSGLLAAEGGSIDIESGTALIVDVTATSGAVSVIADGDLEVQSATSNESVTLTSRNGAADIAQASGDSVNLAAAGNLQITDTVDAGSDLSITSGGLLSISGTAVGETIEVEAVDVAITPDGALGDATRTASIEFTAFGEIKLGGSETDNEGGTGAFLEVDNDEFGRIHSGGDLTFTSRSATSGLEGLITVETLDVTAGDGSAADGQNIGQTGSLVLNAEGDIEILGNLNVANATLDTGLIADAFNLVRLDTANGGIFLLDANDGLAGGIEILATDFIAATDQAFADIDGLSVADIDARLGESDGVDRPDGVIRADSLVIETTASQVFIQNTATGTDFDDRRGFDVNSLFISSGAGTGSVQPIVINGVVAGVTGIDAIALVDIGSAPDPASTINGCVIADPASCAPVTVTPSPSPTPSPGQTPGGESGEGGASETEIRDLIEDGLAPVDILQSGSIEAGLINLNPNAQFEDDPLIDDPVTGAGNEDLWVVDEEEEGEVEPAE